MLTQCLRSQRPGWHRVGVVSIEINYADTVSLVNDYGDMCQVVNNYICEHCVSVVNDYAYTRTPCPRDTIKTMRTLLDNFEGFSQILKEQSGKKMYLGLVTHPIAIN